MKKKRLRVVCVALVLCAAILSGCTSGGGNASKTPKVSGNAVTVSSMKELLEAFKPGAEIVLAKGDYNLTEYINDFWLMDEAASFNAEHEYIEIRDCYDGVEAVVKNVANVTLRGAGDTEETEIVIEPRYGTVLTFEKCDNLKVYNLTMGHTETGECAGSVLELSACDGAELRDLDLYGCGVIGLECSNGTQNVAVYDSILRDCSWGPLDVYDATGKIELHDCDLTGSYGGGYFNGESRLQLGFYDCTFGEAETDYWMFMEGVTFEDCEWSNAYDYPDYEEEEGMEIVFNADALTAEEFDGLSSNTAWFGYVAPDMPPDTDPTIFSLELHADGTGVVYGYFDDYAVPFLWEKSADNSAKLDLNTSHNGALQVTMYEAENDAVSPEEWLYLEGSEGAVWMFLSA